MQIIHVCFKIRLLSIIQLYKYMNKYTHFVILQFKLYKVYGINQIRNNMASLTMLIIITNIASLLTLPIILSCNVKQVF